MKRFIALCSVIVGIISLISCERTSSENTVLTVTETTEVTVTLADPITITTEKTEPTTLEEPIDEPYVMVDSDPDGPYLIFGVQDERILTIGGKINAINEKAYMNSSNWEVFFSYYLEKNAPDVLTGMETDTEAGMYVAFYKASDENTERAKEFARIIQYLIENEDELYRIISEEGENISWKN